MMSNLYQQHQDNILSQLDSAIRYQIFNGKGKTLFFYYDFVYGVMKWSENFPDQQKSILLCEIFGFDNFDNDDMEEQSASDLVDNFGWDEVPNVTWESRPEAMIEAVESYCNLKLSESCKEKIVDESSRDFLGDEPIQFVHQIRNTFDNLHTTHYFFRNPEDSYDESIHFISTDSPFHADGQSRFEKLLKTAQNRLHAFEHTTHTS